MAITVLKEKQDSTTRIYDAFYDLQISPPAGQYEVVNAFFTQYCDDQRTSEAFTVNLFRISLLTKTDIFTLLNSFKGAQNSMQITLTMAYYLNSINPHKAVLYGVNNVLVPVTSVQRNIVQ
jgi:hypothetical protein